MGEFVSVTPYVDYVQRNGFPDITKENAVDNGDYKHWSKNLEGQQLAPGAVIPPKPTSVPRAPRTAKEDFQDKAKRLCYNVAKDKIGHAALSTYNVVWFSKTLKNWKCMVMSTVYDNIYFEVTYNGHDCEAYVDVYEKLGNVRIKDEETS